MKSDIQLKAEKTQELIFMGINEGKIVEGIVNGYHSTCSEFKDAMFGIKQFDEDDLIRIEHEVVSVILALILYDVALRKITTKKFLRRVPDGDRIEEYRKDVYGLINMTLQRKGFYEVRESVIKQIDKTTGDIEIGLGDRLSLEKRIERYSGLNSTEECLKLFSKHLSYAIDINNVHLTRALSISQIPVISYLVEVISKGVFG